jgi:hypothetical protein
VLKASGAQGLRLERDAAPPPGRPGRSMFAIPLVTTGP